MASGYGALCCLSGKKKVNNQDEKARMPVAPGQKGRSQGQGASALSSTLSAISPGPQLRDKERQMIKERLR